MVLWILAFSVLTEPLLAEHGGICLMDIQEGTGEVIPTFLQAKLDEIPTVVPVGDQILGDSHLLLDRRTPPCYHQAVRAPALELLCVLWWKAEQCKDGICWQRKG